MKTGRHREAEVRPSGRDLPQVFSSTLIMRGSVLAKVTAIGAASEIERIGKSLETSHHGSLFTIQHYRFFNALIHPIDTASNIHEIHETVVLPFHYVRNAHRIDTGNAMSVRTEIAAAEAAMAGSEASGFGGHFDKPTIDGPAVLGRVRAERDRFVELVVDAVQDWPEEHRVIARAEFVDDHTLQLSDGTSVKADYIVIATGSRPSIPADYRQIGNRLDISDDVFDWEDLPESVAVFGGGAIGLELGQALHHLGVRVTERFERVLLAIGRQPNVNKLGLANTSLSFDDKGIPNTTLKRACAGFPIMRINEGLLRLYGEVETGRLLGAEMIGPATEHLAHLLAWSLQSGATISELLARPYYHPCIEEGLRTALRDLEKALGVSNREQIPRSLYCGPES